ncbi:hypothetical protein PC114_g15902 [Phytophthora cactorum]|nr:hypothetical protein PC114_g15902 [Phytophthora cactorum]
MQRPTVTNYTIINGEAQRRMFRVFTDLNASCTCLSGLDGSDSWEFRIQTKSSNGNPTSFPATQASMDTLRIDVIQTLDVPDTLQKLIILGMGDSPLPLTFVPEYRNQPDHDLPIARTLDSTSNLSIIELVNIDMFTTVTSVSSFMPSSTTSVTLRNCNITSFGFEFTAGLNNLTQLDLSLNNLVSAYAGTGNQLFADRCSLTFCELEAYNLSYNKLSVFPITPLNVKTLRKLSLVISRGIIITSFTVNASMFEQIDDLEDFKADLPSGSAECNSEQWQTTHGARVCVANDTSSGQPSSGANPLTFVLLAGVLVVILLLLDYDEVKLGRCISRGGFGLVFSGTYRGRQVAIKKIKVNRETEGSQIEQFIREITLMAVLQHPRIVEFIGVAWDALVDFSAVTELMERSDLSAILQNCRENGFQLTWNDHKATIALHIVEALAYLHSLSPKVIHRDLKSKNVLLNRKMEVKLSDFGISRERHGVDTHMAGMGTSFWIAPEVLRGQDYDEKADVFSFGVVLSELDTDDYPYWNTTNPPRGKLQEGEILQLVASGQMRPSFSRSYPASILKVAIRCLHVRPEDRPSAAELVQIFHELVVQELS